MAWRPSRKSKSEEKPVPFTVPGFGKEAPTVQSLLKPGAKKAAARRDPGTVVPEAGEEDRPDASRVDDIFDRLEATPVFQEKLRAAFAGETVDFQFVPAAGQPLLTGLLARHLLPLTGGNLWVVCGDSRVQERIDGELAVWHSQAVLIPPLQIRRDLDSLPDPDAQAERLAALEILGKPGDAAGTGHVVLVQEESLDDDVPLPQNLADERLRIAVGDRHEPEALTKQLEGAGYERVPQVTERGQFALRGGILDVYSWQMTQPARVEFFDDEIESLRAFDLHTQASVASLEQVSLLLRMAKVERKFCQVTDYMREKDVIVAVACTEEVAATIRVYPGPRPDSEEDDDRTAFEENPLGTFNAGDFVLQQVKREHFIVQVGKWRRELWDITLFCHNAGELERFRELVPPASLPVSALRVLIGAVDAGVTVPSARIAVLSASELFGRYQSLRAGRRNEREKQQKLRSVQADYRELEAGKFVVHLEYGIAKYRGLETRLRPDGTKEESLVLEYANDSRLFVPLAQAHLVSKYVSPGNKEPEVNKLGDARWQKTRKTAQASIEDYASRLLRVQAERQTGKGYEHAPDTHWQAEFEKSFIYRETEDQLRAINETKADMESSKPMDRLICGDVGFGKTEVAIRAIFKCVMGGKQAALLVPTTVLAQQHWETFKERMSEYPVRVEMMSRFVSAEKQKEVQAGLADGSVDVVIGTHRISSKDIKFKGLGLVVIDEEQRFGVKHKEQFRDRYHNVDVLTLSATPIPRTLYLSLTGVRDMSTIDTPPPNRFPVQTLVCGYDERIIKSAIEDEIKRQGQVYFLHNRVQTIATMKEKIEALVPKARVAVGHGQMAEHMLEDVMHSFIRGDMDVLVCTTIIESGVNIPNANTIIIDRADRMGMADLYQLRGRVGRGTQKASAILMLPRELMAVGAARKRVSAIKQYSALGSGFKIAMQDLEIRGVGNMLGTEQSGHMHAIGFDLYCQLLKQSVGRLTGKAEEKRVEVQIRVDFLCTNEAEYLQRGGKDLLPTYLPSEFMAEARDRIMAYRDVAELGSLRDLEELTTLWRDRYGRFPEPVENLLAFAELKLRASQKGIESLEIQGEKLIVQRRGTAIQQDGKFPRLTSTRPKTKLLQTLSLLQNL